MSAALTARSALVALLLLGAASLLEAQEPPEPGAGEPGAGELGDAVARVGWAWGTGDIGALRGLFSPDGVRFREQGGAHGILDPRKAGAAIRELWARHGEGRVTLERTSLAAGTPARGFAHFRWRAVPTGTSEPVSYTLFVGMVHGAPGWRIYEIRVLR